MASTYIQRVDSANGNRKVWTWSAWVKRDVLGSVDHNMFSMGEASADEGQFKFSSDQLSFFNDYASSGRVSASQPSRKFRDVNGWYHFVWRHKSDESTASDRWKIYINGERLDPSDYGNPSIPNEDGCYNKWENKDMWFGARAKAQNDNSYQYFSGLMSHIHFCDGYAYDASDFGSTDSTTGEWKINTSPNVQYGSKGFFILKDGNSVTDQSGNGNNCTVGGGTLTKTEDCPSNVFATMNPLDYNSTTIEEGNNRIAWSQSAGNFAITTGTIGMTTGKYYWEAKVTSDDNSTGIHLGVLQTEPYISRTTSPTVNTSLFYGLGIRLATNKSVYRTSNGTDSSISDTWSNNSVIRIAYDGDAGKIYMWKDATEFNGQTFSSNTSFNSATLTAGTMVLPFIGFGDGGSGTKNAHANFNFGNGYFGSTQISSAGTNASGNGIFEYDTPTGFTALSTKGLNL